jgi:hypothetical protein
VVHAASVFCIFLKKQNQNNYMPVYVHFPVSLQKFPPKNPFSLPPPHPRSPSTSTGTGAVISDRNRWRDLLSPPSLPPKTLSFPSFSSPTPFSPPTGTVRPLLSPPSPPPMTTSKSTYFIGTLVLLLLLVTFSFPFAFWMLLIFALYVISLRPFSSPARACFFFFHSMKVSSGESFYLSYLFFFWGIIFHPVLFNL